MASQGNRKKQTASKKEMKKTESRKDTQEKDDYRVKLPFARALEIAGSNNQMLDDLLEAVEYSLQHNLISRKQYLDDERRINEQRPKP